MTKYESLIMKAEKMLAKAFTTEDEKKKKELKEKYNKLINQARNLTIEEASEEVKE